jgi:hypothetical protein
VEIIKNVRLEFVTGGAADSKPGAKTEGDNSDAPVVSDESESAASGTFS